MHTRDKTKEQLAQRKDGAIRLLFLNIKFLCVEFGLSIRCSSPIKSSIAYRHDKLF